MRRARSPWIGLAAGVVGGLIGTAALDLYKKALIKGSRVLEDVSGSAHKYSTQQKNQLLHYHAAHAQTAAVLARGIGVELNAQQRKTATPITHYATGALAGGLYGVAAEYSSLPKIGFGSVFGCVVFAVGNDWILPSLKLLPPLSETPQVLQWEGFTSHALYGAGTELVRRLIRALAERQRAR